MNRRRFLAAMGLSAGGLFLPSMFRPAAASGEGPPRRVVIMFTQHGTWYDRWKMRWPGLGDEQRWSFDLAGASDTEFSDGLRPLHPWRDRLSVVDGLSLVSAEADSAGVLRHEIGQVQALTGAMVELVAGLPLASAPSIDQRIADCVARPDRFRSVEIGVGGPPISVNYRDQRQVLPFEGRPDLLWRRLFGLVGGGQAAPAAIREHGVVLDRVGARYDALAARLGAEDRAKLEIHRDLVRDLQARVEGLRDAACTAPGEAVVTGDYAQDYSAFVHMLGAALSCDLVRVATVHLGDIPGETLGYPGIEIHDEHAHSIYESQQSQQVMTQWTAYHATQFAELLATLDAIPEGDGTVLDNTVCVWLGELADGAHGFDRWPVVMAGGQGLRHGQYLHLPSDTPLAGLRWDGSKLPSMGAPHQKLLTTLGRVMGVTDDDGALLSAMPVTEVVGIDGARIDCTGVIEELLA